MLPPLSERMRVSIGQQQEKSVHAAVKNFEDPDEDHQEIPIGPYIADIYRDGRITEIQTAQLFRLKDKLTYFLPQYEVKVVHPIPHEKWITWVDPATGHLGKRSRSPRTGSFYSAFEELYAIRHFLEDPNLSVELLLIDMEEYRLQDGWGRGGKRGSHRYDRMPVRLAGRCLLSEPRDYMQFIPENLPDEFTTAEFAAAAGKKPAGFSIVTAFLRELKLLELAGRRGRAYLYRVNDL